MKGKLYGIGIGPGDPELITLKAVRVLEMVDVVAIPESRKEKGSIALDIARDYLKPGVDILKLNFPMIRKESTKQKKREENAKKIKGLVDAGKNVAFLTLGDPMIYSTFIYIVENLKGYDIDIETIPGITSFCAVSSRVNMPLAKRNETLAIIPMGQNTDIKGYLENYDNLVFMKVTMDNDRLAEVIGKYRDENRDDVDIFIASNCGTPEEWISSNPEDLHGNLSYMTTLIVNSKRGKSS